MEKESLKITENHKGEQTLSFTKLTAMIIGSTIGGGIFTTAGDMAALGAHTGSVLVGWGICGVGMFCLMMCFFGLNKLRPELTNGIFSYAKEGFGEFVGFNSAWGYWLSALLCNVSYTTLMFGALGYFFPIFGDGNNLLSILSASVLLWLINALILRGVQEAAALNVITTIAKLIPILVFAIAVIFVGAFDPAVFMDNFWGTDTPAAPGISDQIKATTSATVWSFIGVEGAVVLSARARRSSDVGKASLTGFFGILAIYVLIAVLSMGVLTTEELAALKNPQMAGILEAVVGPWGAALVNIGVILSLAGALLGWTILAADCPHSAAKQGVFMNAFARSNSKGSPTFSLYLTNGLVQLFLIVIYFSASTYQVFYTFSTTMIMVPYFLSALYYLKLTLFGPFRKLSESKVNSQANIYEAGLSTDSNRRSSDKIPVESITKPAIDSADAENYAAKKENAAAPSPLSLIFAIIGTLYGVWMLYASGLELLFIACILYTPGIIVYALGKHEKGEKIFNCSYETVIAALLILLALIALFMIAVGKIQPF